jgi:hypothetical protein
MSPGSPQHVSPPTVSPTPEAVRAAADTFTQAVYAHLQAVEARVREDDHAVVAAYRALRAATEEYEDVLFDAYAEVPPFVVLEWTEEEYDDDADDADDAHDDDEDDDDHHDAAAPAHSNEDPTAM